MIKIHGLTGIISINIGTNIGNIGSIGKSFVNNTIFSELKWKEHVEATIWIYPSNLYGDMNI